ncbi:zinc metallopeptidase [Kingella negevensis]|uniref:KPN_02809 family neutral zinc metallopeptidase n=1 Tax=Kingella negevensis TaxID=1522312 RepID=UPI002542DAD0|nr:neutral zinc metallopeptidase [Kingella negevensis]WII94108.1 zinc metallopeptidase [Kingella negevensis]
MRWQDREGSNNIEDRRGSSGGGGGKSPGIIGIIVLLVGAYYGVDLSGLVGGNAALTQQTQTQQTKSAPSQQEQELAKLSSVVLKETENVWGAYFQKAGAKYKNPTMVFYSGATSTACGTGQASAGPFYCPVDNKLYIDLSFYDTMKNQLGAEGDAAFAYVIAHEVGHHVQTLLGTIQKVHQAQSQVSQKESNALSVKLELQADCYAGVWGYYAQKDGLFETGDIEEAYNAAESVGDDTLQERAQGYSVPHTFTHGSSANRKQWLQRGLQTGDINQCNTFATS